MPANGVILRKLAELERVLAELDTLGTVAADRLDEDWKMRRAIERDLQVLVEIVVDICQRFVALSGETPAESGGEAVRRCVAAGLLRPNPAYEQMVRLRNYIVHRYESIDVTVLAGMLNEHLDDFRDFREDVLRHADT